MFNILTRRPTSLTALPTVPNVLAAAGLTSREQSTKMANATWPIESCSRRHDAWPYSPSDFARIDSGLDSDFYSTPRYVTHIDNNAVATLRRYYDLNLPRAGRILELCSSWVSHFPPSLEEDATISARRHASGAPETLDGPSTATGLSVTGYGMNSDELNANPILARRVLKDFNVDPILEADDRAGNGSYDASTCVVSIDYLTKPREVLTSLREGLRPAAVVHLVISNRCFPTKVISRWLTIGEKERLHMVADYLWFSGYRDVEIVTLEDGKGTFLQSKDPLWVVRGKKPAV